MDRPPLRDEYPQRAIHPEHCNCITAPFPLAVIKRPGNSSETALQVQQRTAQQACTFPCQDNTSHRRELFAWGEDEQRSPKPREMSTRASKADVFHPNYHPCLPRDWRRGQTSHDVIIYNHKKRHARVSFQQDEPTESHEEDIRAQQRPSSNNPIEGSTDAKNTGCEAAQISSTSPPKKQKSEPKMATPKISKVRKQTCSPFLPPRRMQFAGTSIKSPLIAGSSPDDCSGKILKREGSAHERQDTPIPVVACPPKGSTEPGKSSGEVAQETRSLQTLPRITHKRESRPSSMQEIPLTSTHPPPHDDRSIKQESDPLECEESPAEADNAPNTIAAHLLPLVQQTQDKQQQTRISQQHQNQTCVEIDAGDGVTFCSSFEMRDSVEDLFAFIAQLVPPGFRKANPRYENCSVVVQFAEPTKLGTRKMRICRERGQPTLAILNEHLKRSIDPSSKGIDPSLKIVLEWQKRVKV